MKYQELGVQILLATAGVLLLAGIAAGAPGAVVQEATIVVKGMICSSCSGAVEQAVKRLDGVGDVTVDLKKNLVRVSYDSSKVTPRQLVEAIRKGGYEARWTADPAR